MIVEEIDDKLIQEIGNALGKNNESNDDNSFEYKDLASFYFEEYARNMAQSGLLYTISEDYEGFIVLKKPGQNVSMKSMKYLVNGFVKTMSIKELLRYKKAMKDAGYSLKEEYMNVGKPFVYVGMVCVCKQDLDHSILKQLLQLAFDEGEKLNVPVIIDTDSNVKCENYQQLGMNLQQVRDLGEWGKNYDLIKYPNRFEEVTK